MKLSDKFKEEKMKNSFKYTDLDLFRNLTDKDLYQGTHCTKRFFIKVSCVVKEGIVFSLMVKRKNKKDLVFESTGLNLVALVEEANKACAKDIFSWLDG
jgi:hypothetical protein